MDHTTPLPIGVLTVSDRAYRGVYKDRGGPAIVAWLSEVIATPWLPIARVVPDQRRGIARALRRLVDRDRCGLVIATGGTGPAPRDVTPEAVRSVCSRMLPGFGEQMRRASLESVPTAILSRQEAGIRRASLLLSLPGNPNAIAECLDAVFAAVPYGIELAGGPRLETHSNRIRAFRPGG